MWGYALLLALLPTVVSFVMMTISVHNIGSTPTAVLGALEPITAVVIGVTVFGEAFTLRLALGILARADSRHTRSLRKKVALNDHKDFKVIKVVKKSSGCDILSRPDDL